MVASIIKKNTGFLIVLVLLAFVVRALVFYGYLSHDQRYWQVDSNTYHLTAQEIAQGHGISKPNGQPQFYRVPGYSLFLAPYYALFGPDTKNVLWLQVLLACFIPVLIFSMSLTLFPAHLLLAKASSLYSSVHLGLVLYSGFFMTETLFIFLFLLFAIFFFKAFRIFPRSRTHVDTFFSKELLTLFFSGIFLGAASLVRPVGHYLLVVSLLLLWCGCGSWLNKCAKNIALICGWLASVSIWLLRNWLLTGYLFFHTLPGGHFLYLSAARVAMHVHETSYQEARQILSREAQELMDQKEKELGRPLQEIETCIVMERLSVKYFMKRPFSALKNWCTDMLRTTLSLYSAELLYLESGRQDIDYFAKGRGVWAMFCRYLVPQTDKFWLKVITYVEMFLFLFILIGFAGSLVVALRGLIFEAHMQLADALAKVLPFMLLFIVISLSGGYARMRLPCEPWLIITSWSFWLYFGKKFFNKELS
ncbi:hypothetical protein JST56_02370 [Candidatus Dependentiae bacterium]|nr:hypothetical protein [Candidatus Dependentiae bacterium]